MESTVALSVIQIEPRHVKTKTCMQTDFDKIFTYKDLQLKKDLSYAFERNSRCGWKDFSIARLLRPSRDLLLNNLRNLEKILAIVIRHSVCNDHSSLLLLSSEKSCLKFLQHRMLTLTDSFNDNFLTNWARNMGLFANEASFQELSLLICFVWINIWDVIPCLFFS